MTAAPNFAYTLFAKRLRRQATPGQFDLSSLRWALSGSEPVEPADVEDLIDAGRVVDEVDGDVLPARGVGVIQVRGESVTQGYTTVAGFVAAQDEQGWYDTGDLGYLTEDGHVVVCGRVKDVIIMAGRKIYPTDIERAAARVSGSDRGSSGWAKPRTSSRHVAERLVEEAVPRAGARHH